MMAFDEWVKIVGVVGLALVVGSVLAWGCSRGGGAKPGGGSGDGGERRFRVGLATDRVEKSDADWRRLLTAEQYRVTRHGGTECSFTGQLDKFYEPGKYLCVCCGNELFDSATKFNSGTGWPSFWAPAGGLATVPASGTEVICGRCDAHLGHVFSDGPEPTGLRFCMNSAALKFVPAAAVSGSP